MKFMNFTEYATSYSSSLFLFVLRLIHTRIQRKSVKVKSDEWLLD